MYEHTGQALAQRPRLDKNKIESTQVLVLTISYLIRKNKTSLIRRTKYILINDYLRQR